MICCNLLVTCIYFVLIGGIYSNDFTRSGDYEYYFGDRNQLGNYINAQQECLKRNATLVIIYTEEINKFIRSNVIATGLNYFIGFQRINKMNNNNGFLWNDGTSLTFNGWATGEPQNKYQTCGEIYSWQQLYGWNDQHCYQNNRAFICQRKVRSCNISNPCGENSHCDDSTGYIRCPCNEGYEGDGFINCTDIDECDTLQNLSFPNSLCVNTRGSFRIDDPNKTSLLILAGVIGILIGMAIMAGVFLCILYKRRRQKAKIAQKEASAKFHKSQDHQMVYNEIYESSQETQKPEITNAANQKRKNENRIIEDETDATYNAVYDYAKEDDGITSTNEKRYNIAEKPIKNKN